jgi:multiple sugar transport system permease protein
MAAHTDRLMVRSPARRRHLGIYVALVVLAAIVLVPFAWMVSTSLKPLSDIWVFPPQWIPSPAVWSNYLKAFQEVPLLRYFGNTMILEGATLVGQVVSCTLIAYGFSRFRFPGREPLFLLMLGTMLIPSQVTMIPLFLLFTKLGWVNTYLPLVVPAYFGNAFYVFLLRQYFMTIPAELDEAAKIDGANSFMILWKILVPLLRPALMIVIVFTFTDVYNNFLGPLIYLNDPAKFPLAVGLEYFVSSYSAQWNLLMAGSTFALIPLLILYYFAQNQLIGGVASFGIKG